MRRQKVVQPTYRIENEYDPEAVAQYFQVTVIIYEGKINTWMDSQPTNSYVIVVLGKQRRQTSIQRDMLDPFHREIINFEINTSIRNLEQLSLLLVVMESQSYVAPKILGEAQIDLRTIWKQPFHQVRHKWVQLFASESFGPVGYLKVDMRIFMRGDTNVIPHSLVDCEGFEKNLLLASESEQQCTKYKITIHRAFGLPNDILTTGKRGLGRLPSTFVTVSFCGLAGKTSVHSRNNNPSYCEQISMVEMFPNINPYIRLDLYSSSSQRIVASVNLTLSDLSHDGDNGYLPTFGPSLVHLYGSSNQCQSTKDGPYYKGALLIDLETVTPYYNQALKTITVKHVKPINTDNLWTVQDFVIYCPIFEVSMLDLKLTGKSCGVAITIGEIPCGDNEEIQALIYTMKSRKLHYTGSFEVVNLNSTYGHINFNKCLPVLQLASLLPDFRCRIYRHNIIRRIVHHLEAKLNVVEENLYNSDYNDFQLIDQLRIAMEDAANKIEKSLCIFYVPRTESNCDCDHFTKLDLKQTKLQREEIVKIYNSIVETKALCVSSSFSGGPKDIKNEIKAILKSTKSIASSLRRLIFKTFDGWPDIVFWLLCSGTRVGYTKIVPADVIYSTTPEESGTQCGRIQTLYMKPVNCPKHKDTCCHCVVCKVETLFWMGLFDQQSMFCDYLPDGFTLKDNDFEAYLEVQPMEVICKALVCKGKFNYDDITASQYFVRINVFNQVKDTQVKYGPIVTWNELIHLQCTVAMTCKRLIKFPPIVTADVFTFKKKNLKLVGRLEMACVVHDDVDMQMEPLLKWHDFYKGEENTGQLLMSALVYPVPEQCIKTTTYSPLQETYYVNNMDGIHLKSEDMQCACYNSYKIDVYWWGLREVTLSKNTYIVMEIEYVTIESEVISNSNPNKNFQNGKTYRTFDLVAGACFSFNIKIYDNSTFGRTFLLGATHITNPYKYLISWLPEYEYKKLVNGVPIISSEFIQANSTLFIKHNSKDCKESKRCENVMKNSYEEHKSYGKSAKWRRMFRSQSSDEEEILLPMNEQSTHTNKDYTSARDWWLTYIRSKENTHEDNTGLIIYESELESQPEFSKFKDWCTTIKLYNGKKTGMSERDEALFCGFLKTGIAIYKYPSILDVGAVSSSGVDLKQGYFYDHPKNDPVKFLVRVYIVKGVTLKLYDYNEHCGLYIKISCAKKYFGDRDASVPNSLNPIFGNVFELSCSLPEEYLLTISIYHCNRMSLDTLIGSTAIDLENRIYSKHLARVGLASEYNIDGPEKWRDCVTPSVILEEVCRKNNLSPPFYPDATSVIFNGIEYRDSNERVYRCTECKENLCLSILNKWQTLPVCGYQFVPRHIETRRLFHPDKVGDQGKIEMWVDIFPLRPDTFIPNAVDIAPKKIENYELSLTIYKVSTHKRRHGSCRNRRPIYLTVWLGSATHALNTDVYYENINGDIDINYQMIFYFYYHPSVKKIIRKQSGTFTRLEEYVPPILMIRLHSDTMSSEDYIGALMLDLTDMPRGSKRVGESDFGNDIQADRVNLFFARNIVAWWPLQILDSVDDITGDINIALTLMPKNEAIHIYSSPKNLNQASQLSNSGNSPCCIDIVHNMVGCKDQNNTYFCKILVTVTCMACILIIAILAYFGPKIVLQDCFFF